MTGTDSFDLVVIGSGPAGEKGAAQAAYFRKRVALVEKEPRVGGAGVNTGTVPSKTLRETALYFSGLGTRGLYGVDYKVKDDITVPDFMYRERDVTHALRGLIETNLERHRIELVHGAARFEDAHTVRVCAPGRPDRLLAAEVVLIASGSVPNWPEGVPRDPRIFDSDSVLLMQRIPRSLAVVGAGVIGCEYATIFRALGVEVTLLCGQDRLLPFLDREIGERLHKQLGLLGLRVALNASLQDLRLDGPSVRLGVSTGEELDVESVLFATGRMGNTAELGLERIGLSPGPRGHLKVDGSFRTAVPGVYAAGDVIGFPALASTSMEQARVAVCHAFRLKYKTLVSHLLPMAIYTIPEIAAVGETEESCREKGIDYLVGRALYQGNSRGQIIGDLSGIVKLLCSATDKRLLGVHILGEMASELVHVGQACMALGGGIDYFIQAVFNYPTLGDAYKYAAYDALGRFEQRQRERG